MGLSLKAVSKDWHYDEKLDEYVGETGSLSTDIGYIGYKFFRDDLIKYCTNGEWEKLETIVDIFSCYCDNETYKVAMTKEDFEEEELKDDKVQEYIKRLEGLKNIFPKIYNCFPFIMHCDCDGDIPYTQLEKVLPILEEYKQKYPNKKYGYSMRKYDWLKDLIDIIKEAIEMKGKLQFA